MYTAIEIERVAYHIAFVTLRGNVRLIRLYLAHVRSLPHGALVSAILSMVEDMIDE
jgi:hypothetical protein